MKKIISAILAAALLFSLCSCARAESVTLERGTVENGVYENGSMGIKINLGEGWTFYSDDEIEENVRPSDFMPGDDTQELEAGDVFCDMYCSNEAATNINISYEYVGTGISIAKYLSALEESVKEQFMELEKRLEQYLGETGLNETLLQELVASVHISQNKGVEVRFKYEDVIGQIDAWREEEAAEWR